MKLKWHRAPVLTAKGHPVRWAQTQTHRYYVHRFDDSPRWWSVQVFKMVKVGNDIPHLGIKAMWIADPDGPYKHLCGVDFKDAKNEAQAHADEVRG